MPVSFSIPTSHAILASSVLNVMTLGRYSGLVRSSGADTLDFSLLLSHIVATLR